MKKVAILQSNYLPWKGYFDMIASVDEFIVYDTVQFTKNDWRNRNRIKTPQGVEWLTIPVGQNINRLVCDVKIPDGRWAQKHFKTLESNYKRAASFETVAEMLEPLYLDRVFDSLSMLNQDFMRRICEFLGVQTVIRNSLEFELVDGKTDRLVGLCQQAGAGIYVSGPAAKSYLELEKFLAVGIEVEWFDYTGYPEYSQLWGGFRHDVSIVDLLFNCGRNSIDYMKYVNPIQR